MKLFRKIIPFFFSFAIIISCCIPSVYAVEVGTSGTSFWDWVAHSYYHLGNRFARIFDSSLCPDSPNENGRHNFVEQHTTVNGVTGNFYICQYCGRSAGEVLPDAYDDVVDDMTATGYTSDGYLIWTPTLSDFADLSSNNLSVYLGTTGTTNINSLPYIYVNGNVEKSLSYSSSNIFPFSHSSTSSGVRFGLYYVHLVAPLSGSYRVIESQAVEFYGRKQNSDNPIYREQNYRKGSLQYYASGSKIDLNLTFLVTGEDYVSCWGHLYLPKMEILPNSLPSSGADDYTVNFRPLSITGDYSVVGDNNEVTVDNSTLFTEDTYEFYNPVTGDTTTMESWSYDYSTRTYTMTDSNDDITTLTYGDDNIIIEDGGNTFYLYYGDITQNNGSGDNGGDNGGSGSSSDSGIFAQIGTLLGSLVGGMLNGLTAFLSAILNALTHLVETIGDGFADIVEAILGWFDDLPLLFDGFLDFLSQTFVYVPGELVMLLTFGVAAIAFIGIIKALRR